MDTIMDYAQTMDYISLILITVPLVVVIACGLFFSKSKNDTMQRNGSKASHILTTPEKYKNYTQICSISTQHNYRKSSNSSNKAIKIRTSNKSPDTTNINHERRKSKGLAVKDWLQHNLYCYEGKFISSCVEDNMSTCYNITHRNSTSSEATATATDDLNSSSSNEDMCSTYLIQKKSSKKGSKSRQKQQKRKKLTTSLQAIDTYTNIQPMDMCDERNENIKPVDGKQISRNAALNLRKQCTKAAALNAVLNNSKLSKSCINKNYEYASSTSTTSSVSSSASSSPVNSVNSSPTASPIAYKRNIENSKKSSKSTPLRQFTKLNMNERELAQQMKRYIIDPSLLRVYGFPVESFHHENSVEIYKCLPKHLAEEAVTKDNQRHHRHFYGRKKYDFINIYDGLHSSSCRQKSYSNLSFDSGHVSCESSPRCTDSDSSELGEEDSTAPVMAFYTPDGVYQIFSEYCNSLEKQCVRCSKMFQVNNEGEYMTFESCTYHWGKLSNVYNGKCYINIYSCCQGDEFSEGCSKHALHVWNGVVVGINGPYTDFVHTKYKESKHEKHSKIYAIDCEMSYTGLGLEVTKVTVVGYDGNLVYEHFVKPQAEIIDYNTRFSGVSENDFRTDSNNYIKSFAEVQNDLLNLFDADTILIGHGLDNDLRVLRLVHKNIVDTSVVFSHSTGYPYRRSLKNLTKSFLKRDIQCSDKGHSSFEDSRACLELMMWKVRKDLRHWSFQ